MTDLSGQTSTSASRHAWLHRQRHFLDYLLASLARRRGKVFSLWLLYSLLVFLLASVMLFTHALRQESAAVLAQSPEVIVQRLVAGRHDLIPPGYPAQIGRIRGVQQQRTRLWGYYYDPVVKANYTLMVPDETAQFGGFPLMPAPGQIIIGPDMARMRGLQKGNLIAFRAYSGKLFSFTVAEILPQPTALMSADLLLLNAADFRAFFDYPAGHATDIVLSVANPREVKTVAAKVAERLPDARPILRDEVLRTYAAIFNWREGVVLTLLSGVLLAFALLAWDKAAGFSAEERREIGILKAIGWETGDILHMKLLEGGLLSLLAFLCGYLAAWGHVFYANGALFRPLLQGWAVLYPQFSLAPRLDGLVLLTLFLITVVPYMAAVLVPGWRAAITDPDTVMRT